MWARRSAVGRAKVSTRRTWTSGAASTGRRDAGRASALPALSARLRRARVHDAHRDGPA
jgi:hypothetical protein